MWISIVAFLGALVLAAAALWVRRSGSRVPDAPAPDPRNHPTPGRPISVEARLLVQAGQPQEALDLLLQQGDFRQAGRVALKMQRYQRAAELFERAGDFEAAGNALLRVPDLRRAAEFFSRAGNPEKAAEILSQVGDLWGAAEALVTAGRLEQAARVYRVLGRESEAHRLSAQVLRRQGRHQQAAELYESLGDYLNAAECYAQQGQAREAAHCYLRAGRADLGGAVLEQAGLGSEAAALYEEAGLHERAAALYAQVQDPDREIRALAAAGRYLEAGRMAWDLGRVDQAEEILRLASPADRGYARACYLLGRILTRKGQTDEAVRYYLQFVERVTPTAATQEAFEHLVGFFTRSQALDAALKTLRKLEAANLLRDALRFELQRLEDARRLAEVQDTSATGRPAAPPAIPPGLPERYQVVRRLGEGGTAIVYLARDQVLDRDVVLKFLSNPHLPENLAEEYFLREARILASLSHPHIVQVYDMGQVSGRQYLVMEYLDGSSLADLLDRVPQHRLPLPRVAVMARELAEALDFAHQHRVIHRDIKPGNVMVLQDGRCKLMDFGMAKALEVHRDRSLFICGTPDYMSPEQEAGHDLTPATDLYSFGLLLMEALLGPLPSGPTARNARDARLQFLDQSSLPRELGEVLRRCLDLDPTARPATSREVADALQRAVVSEGPSPSEDGDEEEPPPLMR
ncbi:MAG TPA: protein kinase [Myxococcota bacterium]|nr:protein kinase [Myxococcota bacterium]HQK51967.1 protein kinase [Myxococcota bacterium]